MSLRAVIAIAALVVWFWPASSRAQPEAPEAPDSAQLRARLRDVEALAHAGARQCEQLDRGCQDIWCRTSPAFDTGASAWTDLEAVQVTCRQELPAQDRVSMRELMPTLGDPYAAPREGWVGLDPMEPCAERAVACREISIGPRDRRRALLHVTLPYGAEARFVEVTVILARAPFVASHEAWVDPRPAPRADAMHMEQHLAVLRQLAESQAVACGVSLGEIGPRTPRLDLATTPIASWPEWPDHLEVAVSCMQPTSPGHSSGTIVASRGALSFGGGVTTPWGPVDLRCIHPGVACAQYTTVREQPDLVMFHVEVPTPGRRGFVEVGVHLHVSAAATVQ